MEKSTWYIQDVIYLFTVQEFGSLKFVKIMTQTRSSPCRLQEFGSLRL